jgi:hypothetical protein
LTNGQKKALHVAARQVGLNDAQRRILQRQVGGFYSAADSTATRHGFIAVMAALEEMAFSRGLKWPWTVSYWRDQRRAARPNDALVYAVRREARRLGLAEDQVVRFLSGPHMSGGVAADLESAPAYWLIRLLEALKAIRRRAAIPRTSARRAAYG